MLTQSELKSVLHYNPCTGVFTYRNHPSNRCHDGMIAGAIKKRRHTSYICITWKGSKYFTHRLAFLYMTGSMPNGDVDHIDGNGLNNEWVNLRDVSRSVNRRNSRMSSRNTSGIAGVSWHKRQSSWEVRILRKSIGYADTIFEAACIRFSKQNFLGGFTERHGK